MPIFQKTATGSTRGVSRIAFDSSVVIDVTFKEGQRIASMQFYGITDDQISAYLSQPAVKYTGDNQDGLEQILIQKYLAFFQNSGWEAFTKEEPVFLHSMLARETRTEKRYLSVGYIHRANTRIIINNILIFL